MKRTCTIVLEGSEQGGYRARCSADLDAEWAEVSSGTQYGAAEAILTYALHHLSDPPNGFDALIEKAMEEPA